MNKIVKKRGKCSCRKESNQMMLFSIYVHMFIGYFFLLRVVIFNFQASLLKNDETKALTPASLQKELNNLLKFNPDFAEAVSLFQNLFLN